jgi:hypothetical protein
MQYNTSASNGAADLGQSASMTLGYEVYTDLLITKVA